MHGAGGGHAHLRSQALRPIADEPTGRSKLGPAGDDPFGRPLLPRVRLADMSEGGRGEAIHHAHHRHDRDRVAGPVIAHPRVDCGIDHALDGPRRKREHVAMTFDAHADGLRLVAARAVDPERTVGQDRHATLAGLDGDDLDLGDDALVLGSNLPAVLPRDVAIEHEGLEVRLLDPVVEILLDDVKLDRLQHLFDAQRSRLDRVTVEVRSEVPVVRPDGLLHAEAPLARRALAAPEAGHAIDHEQHRAGEPQRTRAVFLRALRQIELYRRLLRQPRALLGRGLQAHLGIERRVREVAERSRQVAHLPVADVALNLVRDQDDPSHARDRRDLRVRSHRAAREDLPGHLPRAVEVAEEDVLARDDGAAHVDREPSAWLKRGLEQDAPRHRAVAVLVEVPGVDGDVVLHRGLCARAHREPLARHVRHARDEVVGGPRKARHLALAGLEEGAGLIERVGGAAHGAGDHRGVVEAEAVDVGSGPARHVVGEAIGLQRSIAGQREVGDEAQRETLAAEDEPVPGPRGDVTDDRRPRTPVEPLDDELVLERRVHRRRVEEAQLAARPFEALEAPAVPGDRAAGGHDEEREHLLRALIDAAEAQPRVVLGRNVADSGERLCPQ